MSSIPIVFELKFTKDVQVHWREVQKERLYALLDQWMLIRHEDNSPLMNEVAELLRGLEFSGSATFLPLHPCLVVVEEHAADDDGIEGYLEDPRFGCDPNTIIETAAGRYLARFMPIYYYNLARNLQNATSQTDPSTLDFVPHRLGPEFFRLKPYGFERLFYYTTLETLATALGGERYIKRVHEDSEYQGEDAFINDVYRFGWTGLEFTPIWRG